tara:strand:+ start:262 stop:453 length:192 start_codon:yes stop_codon:yes gene_type:complete
MITFETITKVPNNWSKEKVLEYKEVLADEKLILLEYTITADTEEEYNMYINQGWDIDIINKTY